LTGAARGRYARGPVSTRGRGLWLVLVSCEPAAPRVVAEVETKVEARPARVVEESAAVVVNPALVDRYPSLEYYPDLGARMAVALAGGRPREILAGIAESVAVYRWPSMLDWDRHGFIDVHGGRPGFVTRVAGASISQPVDRHDLGCAGGFLEGVRMTLVPDLAIDELDRCEVAVAVAGGPVDCEPQRAYGWLALRNIAARLRPSQLPAGRRLFELAPERQASLDPLAVPGAMHLCTVSHESTAQGGQRLYHHLMIVLATAEAGALEVFDTTGIRGVALTRMTRDRFLHYCATLLGASREYRYTSRSARLTCLPVAAG